MRCPLTVIGSATKPGPRRAATPTILDIQVRSNVGYARGRVTVATDSPYRNPKTETLDWERLEALQLAKLDQ